MVIAIGSYPIGRRFESHRRYQRSHGQSVKTSPFHGEVRSSTLLEITNKKDASHSVFFVVFYCLYDNKLKLLVFVFNIKICTRE